MKPQTNSNFSFNKNEQSFGECCSLGKVSSDNYMINIDVKSLNSLKKFSSNPSDQETKSMAIMPKHIHDRNPSQIEIPEIQIPSLDLKSDGITILKHKDEIDPISEMLDFIQCFIRPELDFFEHKVPIQKGQKSPSPKKSPSKASPLNSDLIEPVLNQNSIGMFGGVQTSIPIKSDDIKSVEEVWDKATSSEVFSIMKYRKKLRKIQRFDTMENRIVSVKSIYNQEKPKKRLNQINSMNSTLNSLNRISKFGGSHHKSSQMLTTTTTAFDNKILKNQLNDFIIPQSRQTIFDQYRDNQDDQLEDDRLKYKIADINTKYMQFQSDQQIYAENQKIEDSILNSQVTSVNGDHFKIRGSQPDIRSIFNQKRDLKNKLKQVNGLRKSTLEPLTPHNVAKQQKQLKSLQLSSSFANIKKKISQQKSISVKKLVFKNMDVKEASKFENPLTYKQTVVKNFLKVNQNNVQLMSLPKIPVMPQLKRIPKLLIQENRKQGNEIHQMELHEVAQSQQNFMAERKSRQGSRAGTKTQISIRSGPTASMDM